ncbi:hypothetical protein [Pandoraea cepalis]|uniref:PhoU domain-containing protein n=1 Tax=Pandoraea cepalis TaxID=2508294 RepID=A0A5E4W548_9BURK|nr:hypothetical protein [Pandoraea cepalis]VVE18714.1 hypothetical protein PCE31107_03035 [Pandoraea cepalis]
MLYGGPYSAAEEIYLMQAEEATNLRADMREVVDILHAHHTHNLAMAERRQTADHQILETVAALITIANALESLARQADSMPDRVQAVLNAADVTEIHKRLADALALDIWARLGTHSEAEAKRLGDIGARIEKNVHEIVRNLHDANAGKPSLPPLKPEGTAKGRLLSRARLCYIYLLRLSGDVHHLVSIVASVCVALAAIAILVGQLSHVPSGH